MRSTTYLMPVLFPNCSQTVSITEHHFHRVLQALGWRDIVRNAIARFLLRRYAPELSKPFVAIVTSDESRQCVHDVISLTGESKPDVRSQALSGKSEDVCFPNVPGTGIA